MSMPPSGPVRDSPRGATALCCGGMIPVPSTVSRLAHLRNGRAAILLSAVLAASPAAATTSEDVARAAQGLADARRGIAEAGTDGPEGVLALGRAVAAYEAALGSLRDVVIGAGDEERRLALDLAARREEVERLLAALQAIARNPPPAVALHPQGPEGAARAAGVMARITPALRCARAGAASARHPRIRLAPRARRRRQDHYIGHWLA